MPGSTEDLAWLLLPRGKEEGPWGMLNSVYVRFVCATMAHKGHEQRTVVPREAALLLAKSSRRKGMGMGEIKGKEEEGMGETSSMYAAPCSHSFSHWRCPHVLTGALGLSRSHEIFSLERKRSEGSKEIEVHAVCICG